MKSFPSNTIGRIAAGGSVIVAAVLLLWLYLLLFSAPWAYAAFIFTAIVSGYAGKAIRSTFRRHVIDATVWMLSGAVVVIVVGVVVAVVVSLIAGGHSRLTWEFFTAYPKNGFSEGGVFPAIAGTAMLVIIMAVAGVPVGTVTAIYLTEFARESSLFSRIVRFAVNTLAGVPAIVFGLFGLGFFIGTVGKQIDTYNAERLYASYSTMLLEHSASPLKNAHRASPGHIATFLRRYARDSEAAVSRLQSLIASNPESRLSAAGTVKFLAATEKPGWGQPSIFWAALTMALLTLPTVIVTVEEAIRAVPKELREASYALGATRTETVLRVVLPGSVTGIFTGAILAVSRGAGEVAPILFTGAAYYMPDLPDSLQSQFMELGYHIYVLTTQSTNADLTMPLQFATTVALLLLTFTLNITAIVLRSTIRRRKARYI